MKPNEIASCTLTEGVYNNVTGNFLTGANGNSIFLPYVDDGDGSFWTSTIYQDNWIFICFYNGERCRCALSLMTP